MQFKFRCWNYNVVDLEGQLSNPPRAVRSLTEQGSQRSCELDDALRTSDSGPRTGPASGASEQRGQLSNPVQRRLTDTGTDDLVARYEAGSTVDALAREFGIHRTTVMAHLERRGIPRRSPRKLTDSLVTEEAQRYRGGNSLDQIAGTSASRPPRSHENSVSPASSSGPAVDQPPADDPSPQRGAVPCAPREGSNRFRR
jgi:hypothetical protein